MARFQIFLFLLRVILFYFQTSILVLQNASSTHSQWRQEGQQLQATCTHEWCSHQPPAWGTSLGLAQWALPGLVHLAESQPEAARLFQSGTGSHSDNSHTSSLLLSTYQMSGPVLHKSAHLVLTAVWFPTSRLEIKAEGYVIYQVC